MNGPLRTGVVIFLAAAILINSLTGCTLIALSVLADSPEPLAGTHLYNSQNGAPFQKVIVIGLTKTAAERTAIENAFMDQFVTDGISIVGSGIYLPAAASLKERDLVAKTISNGNFDGAIVVEIRNIKEKEVSKWLPAWKTDHRSERGDFLQSIATAGEKESVRSEKIRLEIGLWDMNTSRKVWSGTTAAIDKYDLALESYPAARSTAAALKKTRLLQNH